MALVIQDEMLREAGLTEEELRREIAIFLFQSERLTLAQAARFCGCPRISFQRELAQRRIPQHYDVDDLQQDLGTLREVGLL